MTQRFQESLAMRLRGAYLRMHKGANATFAEHGATADQFVLLSILAEEDGLRQRELADRNFTDANTIAAMVAILERRELVRRQADAGDGLAFILSDESDAKLEVVFTKANVIRDNANRAGPDVTLADRGSLVTNEIRDYIVSCGADDQTANVATFVALRVLLAEES